MTASPLIALVYMAGAMLASIATGVILWRCFILRAAFKPALRRHLGYALIATSSLLPVGMAQLLLMRHVPRWLARPLMTVTFSWLGTLVLFMETLILLEPIRLLVRPGARAAAFLARLVLVGVVLIACVAIRNASKAPQVVFQNYPVPGLLGNYRIVLLSDTHIGPTLGSTFASEIVDTVNPMQADVIIISGDLADGSVQELEPETRPFRRLQAREGVIFVLGNHEYLSGVNDWVRYITSLGWRVLRNSRAPLSRVDVVGLDDYSGQDSVRFKMFLARMNLVQVPEPPAGLYRRNGQRPLVLVAHDPLSFMEGCRQGVDVALAGHTHGGQIFPFGLLEWIEQGYVAGAYRCGSTRLYVSSGAGFWGPPMRLASRSEITVLDLTSARISQAGPAEDPNHIDVNTY